MSSSPMQDEQTSKEQNVRRGMLADFSFVQVCASTLAAVTSALLSAHIGIIGGVVAVGVGAAVSAVASQVYRALLEASHKKLKAVAQEQTTLMTSTAELSPTPDTPAEKTQLSAAAQATQREQGAPANPYKQDGASDRLAPAYLRNRAKKERRTILVATALVTLITLGAVAVTAAIINAATQGSGLGTKTDFSSVLPQVAESQSPATTVESTTSVAATATTQEAANTTAAATDSASENSTATNGTATEATTSTGTSASDAGSTSAGSEGTNGSTENGAAAGEEQTTEGSTSSESGTTSSNSSGSKAQVGTSTNGAQGSTTSTANSNT